MRTIKYSAFGTSVIFFIFLCNRQNTIAYPVQQVTSFIEAQEVLKTADANSIVLFDIDDTLITAVDVFARGRDFPLGFYAQLLIKFPEFIQHSVQEELFSLIYQQAPRILVESAVIKIINDLKARGCLVLGLTSMESGSYGVMPNMPVWRSTMLKRMGIEFSAKYPNETFNGLKEYRGTYPILFDGILCCNQQPKGDVLNAFLTAHDLHPSQIVFFDDSTKHLQSVGAICAKHNISCMLFEYRGAYIIPGEWNDAVVLKQIETLLKEQRWISDSEARLGV